MKTLFTELVDLLPFSTALLARSHCNLEKVRPDSSGSLVTAKHLSATLIAASSSLHPNSRIIRIRSAFSCFSVIPSASHRAGETTRNNASTRGESTTPSVYFPGALVALSSSCRCSGVRDLKRLTCSTSSGGITSSSHHSIILSSFFASSGKSLRFCVASHSQIPSLILSS